MYTNMKKKLSETKPNYQCEGEAHDIQKTCKLFVDGI